MIYGYARVSTHLQETDLQLDALQRAGVDLVFQEKTSSVGRRPELRGLLTRLNSSDVLVVYKLDRLARSLRDLLTIIHQLQQVGCGFKSLTEPIDTTTPAGLLMLGILGSVAEFERSLIRERTIAGQLAAMKRGVKLGCRPSAFTETDVAEMKRLHASGDYTYPDIARMFGAHPSTIKRHVTGKRCRQVMPVLSQYL